MTSRAEVSAAIQYREIPMVLILNRLSSAHPTVFALAFPQLAAFTCSPQSSTAFPGKISQAKHRYRISRTEALW